MSAGPLIPIISAGVEGNITAAVRIGSKVYGWGLLTSGQDLWTSADGKTWTQIPLDPRVFPFVLPIRDMAGGGPGLVAVGGGTSIARGQHVRAEVWLSNDGRTWKRIPDERTLNGAVMTGVVAGGPGLIAVGNIEPGEGTPISPARGIVWTSIDGRRWSRVADPQRVFVGAEINNIVRGGPGFIATGESSLPSTGHAVVWTSTNGVTWYRAPRNPQEFPNDGPTGDAVAGPGGYLGTSTIEPPTYDLSPLWTSSDGVTWKRVPSGPFRGAIDVHETAGGPGYLAVGDQDYEPVMWSSSDGTHWSRVADGAVFRGNLTSLSSVVMLGSNIIVIGKQEQLNTSTVTTVQTAWVWTPGSTVTPPPLSTGLDPKTLRLRQSDLPAAYGHGQESYADDICVLEGEPDPGGRVHRLCDRILQALGTYNAYTFSFTSSQSNARPSGIAGTVIAGPDVAHARRTLKVANLLLQPIGAPPAKPIPAHVAIGRGFNLYHVTMNGTAFAFDQSLSGEGTAAVWRVGRVVEMIEVTETGNAGKGAAIRYARRLWQHIGH